ncbi:uridine kinase family protein [Vallicoccus soli]|uniref:uridine kinase family protein n=1 Tax=Vallicoccus soli TaxID=2339232 RepID=UPI001C49959D|nr:uridine kinase [Vallicoccus soli]
MEPRRVVLLTGPSGCGKSRLARASGLPVLNLDDFYKDGDDPTLPVDEDLGIADWDDPRSWDGARAVAALEALLRDGAVEVPVYDIAHDRATSHREFSLGGARTLVAEGIFAAEVVGACRERGLLADALVVRRAPWKNFLRRLARDLAERRKGPAVLVRRGLALMREEPAVVARQVALGCRACSAEETLRTLRSYA